MTESRARLFIILFGLAAFGLLIGLEAATEGDDFEWADFAVDAVAMFLTVASAASVAALFVRVQLQQEERASLLSDLDAARAEGAEWRAAVDHHVNGLKSAIDRQFEGWSMTRAERDVALLILKGFSHKEIAALRKTSEATVRQQAQSIYRKAGLSGKNALTAFFLEDLLSAPALNGGNGSGADGRAIPQK
jgi:DNA-binding NarL/FixJ family response regulator